MITSLDPDPESDFQLYGDSRFGSNVKRNYNTDIGVIILAQDPIQSRIFRLLVIPDLDPGPVKVES